MGFLDQVRQGAQRTAWEADRIRSPLRLREPEARPREEAGSGWMHSTSIRSSLVSNLIQSRAGFADKLRMIASVEVL